MVPCAHVRHRCRDHGDSLTVTTSGSRRPACGPPRRSGRLTRAPRGALGQRDPVDGFGEGTSDSRRDRKIRGRRHDRMEHFELERGAQRWRLYATVDPHGDGYVLHMRVEVHDEGLCAQTTVTVDG